jgi:murein DD-endopeptidase MepM/ murein hydrolase activator NlpD
VRTLLGGVAAVAVLALAGCGGGTSSNGSRDADTPRPSHRSDHEDLGPRKTRPTKSATATTSAQPSEAPEPSEPADPRWRFYTEDHHWYRSPWFEGRHQVMVPFGCTSAPYYDPDPSCPDGHGKHHGIDVAMPCGTPLLAGRPATVLDHAALGPAYGANPVLLRVGDQDVVIGHTVHVFVQPGDHLATGERFALAGDSGAPDGCHLHFEVRPAGGDYTDAVDPHSLLGLAVAGAP